MTARIVILLVVAASLAGSAAWGEDGDSVNVADNSWHLLTVTQGGTVSLIKNLNRRECEVARNRATGWMLIPGVHLIEPGTVISSECFQ